MDIFNNLNGLSAKIQQQAAIIQTEEATKSAFVMPFISQMVKYIISEYLTDEGHNKRAFSGFFCLNNCCLLLNLSGKTIEVIENIHSSPLITESALSGEYLMWLVKIQNQPFKVNFFEKKPF